MIRGYGDYESGAFRWYLLKKSRSGARAEFRSKCCKRTASLPTPPSRFWMWATV